MFANEMKCRLKQQGINIHNFRQLLQMASPEWEKLSTEEKDTYKEKSKTSEKIPHQARTVSLSKIVKLFWNTYLKTFTTCYFLALYL